ncbi:MAG: sulfotransferase domain-containing protein [Planctomycetaceae bacterium]|nr:sulfotransferase domain-containing protein [Planctomycetaceae bacterium]
MINKVLLVSGSANFSTRDVWEGYRLGLQIAGVEVIPYPTFSMLKVLSIETVCSEIIGKALDLSLQIDCVIFIDGLYFRGERSRVPLSIRKAGIPTVLVATDDPYEPMGPTSTFYTYRFSNEIKSAEEERFYLPTATLPPPAVPLSPNPQYDLSFIGTVFDDRLPLLIRFAEYCETNSLRMLIAGKFVTEPDELKNFSNLELRSRTIDSVEKWEIYADSKVTLNLFRESEFPAESPSPRVFEVTGYGHCALLTGPYRQEVDQLFRDTIYHFDDFDSAVSQLNRALDSETERTEKVQNARKITLASHLYHHRASQMTTTLRESELALADVADSEHKLAWIVGYARSGSTWLAEMLGSLPRISRWHEPYFGRLFRFVMERPEERDRLASFYSHRFQHVWVEGVRELFFKMVQERFPTFGEQGLVVKEVNTPELYPWLKVLFPAGRMIFLTRDPFDTLDSFLDLQSPGSWNEDYQGTEDFLSLENVEKTCVHIQHSILDAIHAYEGFPEKQRLIVRYEDLLTDPAAQLIACGNLISIEVKPGVAAQVADKHRFDNTKETGPGKFRRKGKAGVWKESAYFTPETLEIAHRILGPVRARLGY